MDRNINRGFTLVELVVALAVAGILLGIGVPSFMEVIRNSRLSTDYNELVGALYLARSEAIKGSDNVSVCARASDTQCGNDWNNGILVFADSAAMSANTAQVVNATDILRIVGPLASDNLIIAKASDNRTAAGMTNRNFIRYGSEGASNWPTGTFQVCDEPEAAERGRAVNVVLTGDLRPGRRVSETSKAPMDVFSTAIECK